MCFFKKSKPKIELLSMLSDQVQLEVKSLKMMFPCLLDAGQPYFYTTSEGWAEVFDYIYFKYPMPPYIVARMDCDGFAIWMAGLVQATLGLNYFAIVLGDALGGYHAWNLFRDDQGLLQLEPQTGKFFKLGDHNYFPEYVLL